MKNMCSIESERATWSIKIIDFLREIGIPVAVDKSEEEISDKSFLPDIRVSNGGLIVNSDKVFPGDLLHEAGHLAVIPQHFRHLADKRLRDVFETMRDFLFEYEQNLGIGEEDLLTRGIAHSEESEATAWQYAAAQAIGLPDKWLFPKDSYNGLAHETLAELKASVYFGIDGLHLAGWTSIGNTPEHGLPVYPELAFWLNPGVPAPLATKRPAMR